MSRVWSVCVYILATDSGGGSSGIISPFQRVRQAPPVVEIQPMMSRPTATTAGVRSHGKSPAPLPPGLSVTGSQGLTGTQSPASTGSPSPASPRRSAEQVQVGHCHSARTGVRVRVRLRPHRHEYESGFPSVTRTNFTRTSGAFAVTYTST